MLSRTIDRLLTRILRLRLLAVGVKLVLMAVAGFLSWRLVLLIAEKYLFYYPTASFVLLGGILLVLLIHSLGSYFRENEARIAEELDREYGLKDRLTTYVQLRETDHPFLSALAHEAEGRLSTVKPMRSAGLLTGILPPLLPVLLLLLLILIVPYLPVPERITTAKQQQQLVQLQAKELQKTIRRLEQQKLPSTELRRLLAEFENAARDLQKPTANKVEAFKRLNALHKKLRKSQQQVHQQINSSLARTLKDVLPEGSQAPSLSSQQNQQMEDAKMQEALRNPGSETEQEVRSLAEKMNPQDREKLKQSLEEYKAQRAESEKMLAELQRALENTKKGLSQGQHKFTADSTLPSRDMEKAKGGVEDGPGTTNLDLGPQRFDTTKQGKGEYVEDRTKAEYEQLYHGQRESVRSDPLFLGSQWNDSAETKYMKIRTFGVKSDATVQKANIGLVPQSADESEIRKEKIPASYQKIVKKYLESIQQPE